MRRTILAPLQAVAPQLIHDEHSPVSALSVFSDETWNFLRKRLIPASSSPSEAFSGDSN
jgi:hypothetical protein